MTVTKTTSVGESASAVQVVEVKPGSRPSVAIVAPPSSGVDLDLKQSPSERLPLLALGSVAGVADPNMTYIWSVSTEFDAGAAPIDLSLISSTGRFERTLVIRPGALTPGGRPVHV